MSRLFLSFSLLVTLAALSGCTAEEPYDGICPERNYLGRVDAWADSEPPQAKVDDIVIRG